MAVSRTVIAAYKSAYTLAELKVMLKAALEERASGVLVTQVSFQDGGGSGQMLATDPNEMIEILQITISEIESGESTAGALPMASRLSFRNRRSET